MYLYNLLFVLIRQYRASQHFVKRFHPNEIPSNIHLRTSLVVLSPVREIFSLAATACVDVYRPSLCRPGGAIGVVRPAYGPANHPRTLSAFDGCGAETDGRRLRLFVCTYNPFSMIFQVYVVDIVSVGGCESTKSNFQAVSALALSVLRRVNRPL